MLPDFIEDLLDPAAYPEPPQRVDLVQTHISYVLLSGDHVYKIKKAVNLGFLDFSSPQLRKHYCEEEVRLNRRLCSSLYYGVEPVVRGASGCRIGGEGAVVDYAVHMRRLPAGQTMDVLVEKGDVTLDMVGRLADRIVRFHGAAPTSPVLTEAGGFGAFAGHWLDNFDQLLPYVGKTLSRRRFDRLLDFARSTLAREEPLFRRREGEGRVRDGHGDLRCESVCFDFPVSGEVCISDCIEFGEAYRVADTGLDAGFLAMDLEARGRPDLADLFVGLYCAAAGDRELPLALPAFKSYRAIVRGKVNSLETSDPEIPPREKARARREAATYLRLAESYTRHQPGPVLILVRGLTGSGKSVLAGALASRFVAALLTTDVTRKQLYGEEPTAHARAEFGAGIYSAEATERVYGRLAEEAVRYSHSGRSVVLDGTFLKREQRLAALAAAGPKEAALVVECWAPETVIQARQAARDGQAWTTSDASWETYLRQKELEEPFEAGEGASIRVDTTASIASQIESVMRAIKASARDLQRRRRPQGRSKDLQLH